MKALFSWAVWKRPCPNLEVVSMNLSSIFSVSRRLWCTRRDWGSIEEESLKMEVPTPSSNPQFTYLSSARTPPFLLSPFLMLFRAGWRTRQDNYPLLPKPPAPQLPNPLPALTFLSVMTRFLVPAMQPFSMTKSLLTSP